MKNVILKRTVAVIFIFVLLCLSVLPCFAVDVSFSSSPYTTYYMGNNIDTGVSTYPYNDLYEMLVEYHTIMPSTYYFELQNTIEGGNSYGPDSVAWYVPYAFDQTGFGVGNPIYKFYLPWNPVGTYHAWNFQIRTVLGNVIFDSKGAQMLQDSNNPSRGYYQFEWNRNILGVTSGWYIYCTELPPLPITSTEPIHQITINYVYNSVVVANKSVLRAQTREDFTIDIPPIPNYVINTGYETRHFSNLLTDVSINVPVTSFQDMLNNSYNNGLDDGFDEGYKDGRASGLLDGYSNGYRQGDEDGYQRGFEEGYELGNSSAPSNPLQTVPNPLAFVLEPVVSFLNINIIPGLSLGILIAAAITVSLVVIFLRIFSGG